MRIRFATCAFAFFAVLSASTFAQVQGAAPSAPVEGPVPKQQKIRVGGNVALANLVSKVTPEYPEIAKNARVSGTVKLHALIGTDGTIVELEYVSGPPLLMKSAMDAVRQWRYKPTLLNGYPVEVDTTATVVFELEESGNAPKEIASAQPVAPIVKTSYTAALSGSIMLPPSWTHVNVAEAVEQAVYLGGDGPTGGTFGVYDIEAGTFSDLSALLPPAWCPVKSLAYGNNQLFVGGGRREGCVGLFSPVDSSFRDITAQFRGHDQGAYYYGGINAVGFNGHSFLIGGAGIVTSLETYSPDTHRFTNASIRPDYFAVNTITSDGDSFLIAGAGPGPGPAQPPALGLIGSDGSFSEFTKLLPKGWGTTWRSAYDGKDFFIQGFDAISGKRETYALFDFDKRIATDVTDAFPSSLNLHCVDGRDGYFLVGGEVNGTAYLGRYTRGATAIAVTNLPEGTVDVTGVKIVGNKNIVVGKSREGQLFIATIS
jgi:TonB family protein